MTVVKANHLFPALAFAGAPLLLVVQAKGGGAVSLNNYDSGFGLWLVQNGTTNPAPARTIVELLGGPDAAHLAPVTNTSGVCSYTVSSGDLNALGPGTGGFFDYSFGPVAGGGANGTAFLRVVAWYGTASGASAVWSQPAGSDAVPSGEPPPLPTPASLRLPRPVYLFGSGGSAPAGVATGGAGAPAGATPGRLGGAYGYSSSDLWLEIPQMDPGDVQLYLHGTKTGTNYVLLTKTNLNDPAWTLEQLVVGSGDPTWTYLLRNNRPDLFIWAVGGGPLVYVGAWNDAIAVEPNSPTSAPYEVGSFVVSLFDPVGSDVTVAYRLGGTATQGVDYTNLTGTVTIPAGQTQAYIYLHPLDDGLLDFDETVTLTLALTNGYLPNPGADSATLTIIDNPFRPVATLDAPADVDFNPANQSLIVSVNAYHIDDGEMSNNFVRIDATGVITPWSGVRGLHDEVKLATVKTTANGFTAGDMFFSTDVPGQIGWVSADGSAWTTNWVILPGETNRLRGSLYIDQTGIWNGDLLAVTGEGIPQLPGSRSIWRIDANKNARLVAHIETPQLEGLITLPNDPRYGPWAGKLLTSGELASPPAIYAIDTTGTVTPYFLPIAAADFDLIPPNPHLYASDPGFVYQNRGIPDTGTLLELSRAWPANYAGDLLITQSGETGVGGHDGAHFIVYWDATISNFAEISIPPNFDESSGGYFIGHPYSSFFEHSAFAPIVIPPQPRLPYEAASFPPSNHAEPRALWNPGGTAFALAYCPSPSPRPGHLRV